MFYTKSSTLVDFYTDETSQFEPATFQMLCNCPGQCKTWVWKNILEHMRNSLSRKAAQLKAESVWGAEGRQPTWVFQLPQWSSWLILKDLVVCNRCSFALSFLIFPWVSNFNTAIPKSIEFKNGSTQVTILWKKFNLSITPQRPSIGSLPLLTHPTKWLEWPKWVKLVT